MQLLQETLTPTAAAICELRRGTDLYLKGIMMQAELKNGNGRVYPLAEISAAVSEAQKRIQEGFTIMGELNHPDTLSINLDRVSHIITEVSMDGNNAVGKMKLLNTPCGNIAKALVEGGARIGVSSRGTGNVNESGAVSGFALTTVDIVSTPSAPNAYPDAVMEALGNKKIMSLAEAVVHDKKAQQFFKKEILGLLEAIRKGAK